MRALVLGGTRFVGRHLVTALLGRDVEVTIVHRGLSPSPFKSTARHVHADRRNPSAEAVGVLAERWDLVVDTCGYDPADLVAVLPHVRSAERYLFLSSCSVYQAGGGSRIDERTSTISTRAPRPGGAVGKLRAEQMLRSRFRRGGTRLLIARLGLVAGRFDPTGRLAYWITRGLRPAPALVPMSPAQPLQLVDAADVARIALTAALRDVTGIVNINGPTTTASDLVTTLFAMGQGEPIWVTERFALARGLRPWTQIPLWLPPSGQELHLMAAGSGRPEICHAPRRPLRETLRDTAAWWDSARHPQLRFLDDRTERRLLQEWAVLQR